MGKRVLIVHRYGGGAASDWYAWLRGMLEARGFEVMLPEMPSMDGIYSKPWVDTIKGVVKTVDADTYFVGHDFGCFAILKFIDSLFGEQRAGGAVFIAPYMISERLNFEKIRISAGRMVAVFAKDDPLVPVSDSVVFDKELGATVTIMPLKTHFLDKEGYTELHIALNELLKIAGLAEAENGPGEI